MPTVSPSTHIPAMRSDYNEFSKGQRTILDVAMPYIKAGIDAHNGSALPTSPSPMIIADFGSSTGANSSAAMSIIVQQFREKYGFDRTRSILTVHEDLPSNSWDVLFNFMNENNEAYVKKHEGVYSLAIGRSFTKQILPNNCLQFGFSSVALHWLSKLPTKIKNHCLPWRGSPEEQERFRKQAAEDWEDFLTARSAELVSGGVLVLNVMSGRFSWMDILGDAFFAAVSKLRDQGDISNEEALNFNVRMYPRSLDDVCNSDLLQRLNLEIVAAENCPPIPNNYYAQYCEHKNISKWADDICSQMMAVFEPAFVASLRKNDGHDDKSEIVSKLTGLYTQEIMKLDPNIREKGAMIFLVFKKK